MLVQKRWTATQSSQWTKCAATQRALGVVRRSRLDGSLFRSAARPSLNATSMRGLLTTRTTNGPDREISWLSAQPWQASTFPQDPPRRTEPSSLSVARASLYALTPCPFPFHFCLLLLELFNLRTLFSAHLCVPSLEIKFARPIATAQRRCSAVAVQPTPSSENDVDSLSIK